MKTLHIFSRLKNSKLKINIKEYEIYTDILCVSKNVKTIVITLMK